MHMWSPLTLMPLPMTECKYLCLGLFSFFNIFEATAWIFRRLLNRSGEAIGCSITLVTLLTCHLTLACIPTRTLHTLPLIHPYTYTEHTPPHVSLHTPSHHPHTHALSHTLPLRQMSPVSPNTRPPSLTCGLRMYLLGSPKGDFCHNRVADAGTTGSGLG